MLVVVAKAALVAAALFFLVLGLLALFRPSVAKRFLLDFATSASKHYVELSLRLLVGGAMLATAPHSAQPMGLTVFGWLLIGTTLVMALVPWRTHRRFAETSVPQALRFLPMIGASSMVLSGWLLWSVFIASAA
ncbi:hypothetical protein [Silanimonas algicola]